PHIPNYKSAIVTLRKELDLYANLRPFFSLPNVPCIRPDLRFAIVRENTEGFYSGIEEGDDEKATSLRIITKKGSERIIRFAFEYAKKEGFSKVTLLHKASIFRKTDGLFLSCGNKIAEEYKDRLDFEDALIDSAAMRLILSPYDFQVIVTTNLFGDILSDEASALVGGLGVAPSGNYGEKIALFEPIHGSAPKYAGKDYVNPTGMLLSASMMLKYLGFKKEAKKLEEAISKTYLKNIKTKDVGGNSKTSEFIYAVERNIE
ncbi:MAG: isocitrate/isopropylmalate family dehydrogenase, partial [Candidatus Anstonellales archaeon]